jgi:DNA-binding LytR/AlgR family response regulator
MDDEPAGRKVIEDFVLQTDFLHLAGSVANPTRALPIIEEQEIQLLFLDIQMPKMSGIDFLKSLRQPPMAIMITAYSEYAIQGFELDVIDYLLKPVSKDRFLKAAGKARDFWELKSQGSKKNVPGTHFFIKCNNQYEKITFDELLYVEAANNYVILHTPDKKLNTYLTFKAVSEYLPKDKFLKVHKSFIVALDKINAIDGEKIMVNGEEIPISRGLKSSVLEQVLNKNVIRR